MLGDSEFGGVHGRLMLPRVQGRSPDHSHCCICDTESDLAARASRFCRRRSASTRRSGKPRISSVSRIPWASACYCLHGRWTGGAQRLARVPL